MSKFHSLTKLALIAECSRLESENETLRDELDRLSDCYSEMENQLADKTNALESEDSIRSVHLFKYALQLDNLLTPELESFIDNYLKYYNEI